jgi:voltage-gated potassium channel
MSAALVVLFGFPEEREVIVNEEFVSESVGTGVTCPPDATPYEKVRWHVFDIVSRADNKDEWASRLFDWSMMMLILLNVIALMLETMVELQAYKSHFHWFEIVSLGVFTVEYIARVWSCTVDPQYAHPVWGRLKFARRPMVVIDLIAILPVFLPFIGGSTRVVRAVRLIRVLRLLKIGRYNESIAVVGKAVEQCRGILMLSTLFTAVVLLIMATAIYNLEHDAQPEAYPDIPRSLWWAVVTMSTVGYGDVYPVTDLGKVVAGAGILFGIALVALPGCSLAAAFTTVWDDHIKTKLEAQEAKEEGGEPEAEAVETA